MAVQNSLTKTSTKATFSTFITSDAVKSKINQMIGGKDGQAFITAIISAVSTNTDLQECDHSTILSAAMLGQTLKLSPSPQLGHYYMVPFKDKKNNRIVSTFVLGYKGYIQLAIRSGEYKKINVLPIKDGELRHFDPLNEEIKCELIQDEVEREKASTIGYYAMFELMNGFRKAMYFSKEKMLAHADNYSKAFSAETLKKIESGKIAEDDMWKYSSFWYKDFDGMACKTMLRQLISKWGIMSIEMQKAYERDESFSEGSGDDTFEYVNTIEAAAEVESVADPEEKPQKANKPAGKKGKNTQGDPLAGSPFEEDEPVHDVPGFVTDVEEQA